jgi:hypothetical protein
MLKDMLLYGALIPGAAAGLIALLISRLASGEQSWPKCAPVAIGGGFAIAFAAYFGVEDLFAPQSWQWILWAGVLAIPSGLLRGRLSSIALVAFYSSIAAALVLYPMIGKLMPHELDQQQVLIRTVLLAAVAGILAGCLEVGARSFSAKALAPAWTIYAAGFAALTFELGSARLGQMAGFVAAACGALAALAWIQSKPQFLRGGSVAIALVLMHIAANTYFFGYDVVALPLFIAGLPPIFLAIGSRWSWLRNLRPIPAAISISAIVAVPLGCAFLLATIGAEDDQGGSSDLPY